MTAIFVKAAKGVAEIEALSGGPSPRVRRVLIPVDGRRTVDEVRALTLADDLTHALGALPSITVFRALHRLDPIRTAQSE